MGLVDGYDSAALVGRARRRSDVTLFSKLADPKQTFSVIDVL